MRTLYNATELIEANAPLEIGASIRGFFLNTTIVNIDFKDDAENTEPHVEIDKCEITLNITFYNYHGQHTKKPVLIHEGNNKDLYCICISEIFDGVERVDISILEKQKD